jgi:hypothetical protein
VPKAVGGFRRNIACSRPPLRRVRARRLLLRDGEETLAHARAGHCVAREVPDESELPAIVLGRPSIPIEPSPEQRAALKQMARERAIDDILAWNLSDYSRCSPTCNFPVPDFRSTCRVCNTHLGRINEVLR